MRLLGLLSALTQELGAWWLVCLVTHLLPASNGTSPAALWEEPGAAADQRVSVLSFPVVRVQAFVLSPRPVLS